MILFNNIEDNISKDAPLFAAIQKRNPYLVPNNYFQKLKNSTSYKSKEKKKTHLRKWLSLAACMVICLISFLYIITKEKESVFDIANPPIAFEDALNYYLDQDELDQSLFLELTSETKENTSINFSDLDNETLESYLDLIISDFSDEELEAL